MQPRDSDRCPRAPVQPADLTAEPLSTRTLRVQLASKDRQLQELQREVDLLRMAARAPEAARQAATEAAVAAAAAEHQLQALNLLSSIKSPSSIDEHCPGTAAGMGLGGTNPVEVLASAAAAATMTASAAAAPAMLPPGNSHSSNPVHSRSLHPLVATAAAATAAVTIQAEVRRLSSWDNTTLPFKERAQTLADAAAKQQSALDLDLGQLTDQDLTLMLQPIELELAAQGHLGDPIDKSKVVLREVAREPKKKGATPHVSADNSSRGAVSGDEEVSEATPESSNHSRAVISYYEFAQHFHLAASEAAVLLGMGLTKFKTKIREIGIKRWPKRKYEAIEDAIAYLQNKADGAKDHAAKPGRVLMLRHLRCLLDKYPNMDSDAHPARDLIDALHKQRYKKRKQAEKEGQPAVATAGADITSATAEPAAAAGLPCSAGPPGSQCVVGDATRQQQQEAGDGKRICRRRRDQQMQCIC